MRFWQSFYMFINNQQEEKYVLLKGAYGMGNRMLAFAGALAYAQLSKRKLVVDWSDGVFSPDQENVFQKFFSSPNVVTNAILSAADSIVPAIWKGNLDKSSYRMVDKNLKSKDIGKEEYLSIKFSKLYRETIAVIVENGFPYGALLNYRRKFPPEWRGLKKYSLLRYLLKNYLFLKPEIRQRIDDFKEKHFKSKMIGIHVRQGDKMHPKLLRVRVELKNYHPIIDKLLESHPDAYIFLATDSRRVLEDYCAKYPAVVSTDKWYSQNELIGMHLDRFCPDKVEMGMGALVDMYLLAECNWLVCSSQSSFARVARALSSLDVSHLFDTRRVNNES